MGHIFTGLLLHSRIETYLSSKLFKESHKNLAPYLLTKMNELLALPEERSSFVIAAHVQVLRASGVEEMDKMSPAQLMLPQLLRVTNQQTSPCCHDETSSTSCVLRHQSSSRANTCNMGESVLGHNFALDP